MLTPANIFDYRDRQIEGKGGHLTFRLYGSGWLVRWTPYEESTPRQKIEDADVLSACRFANDRL